MRFIIYYMKTLKNTTSKNEFNNQQNNQHLKQHDWD